MLLAHQQQHHGRALERWLEAVYSVPNVLTSYEDALRHYHYDLACLSVTQLHRERRRIAFRLDCEDEPHHWLAERDAAIVAELRRRAGRGRA